MAMDDVAKVLRAKYVGKTLQEVPTPSAVFDLAKVEVNCQRMLDTTKELRLGWRAHIKTHKTIQLTRLQVGDDVERPANVIASTLTEVENITPLLKEYQAQGRKVNVLLGFPIYPSVVTRLAAVSSQLGPGGLAVLLDHPAQLSHLPALTKEAGGIPPLVFLKVDMGYGRAGVVPDSATAAELIKGAVEAEKAGNAVLHGLYCHAGHSYGKSNHDDALSLLSVEFLALQKVASVVRELSPGHKLALSVGATPTATSLQQLNGAEGEAQPHGVSSTVHALFDELRAAGLDLEVHAGVYPALDLQQLATHARNDALLSSDDIAITILAEVVSVYAERGVAKTTEALVNAGTLALGREPVNDNTNRRPEMTYKGWGMVSPWNTGNAAPGKDFPIWLDWYTKEEYRGWLVGRISQEHGILTWRGKREDETPLQVGQRVRIWPNHACVAGAGFDCYLIVDSRVQGREDEVIDVWPRWRGW